MSDVCPKHVEKTTRGLFTWPKTITGYQQSLPCPFGRSSLYARQPLAFRKCLSGGVWEASDLDTCQFSSPYSRQITQLYMDSERVMKELKGEVDSDMKLGTARERVIVIAHKLANITKAAALMENIEDVQYCALTIQNLFLYMDWTKIFITQNVCLDPFRPSLTHAVKDGSLNILGH